MVSFCALYMCKKNTEMQYMCVKWTIAIINSIRGQYRYITNII